MKLCPQKFQNYNKSKITRQIKENLDKKMLDVS